LIFSSKRTINDLGGENMIKTTLMLMDELKDYVNKSARIRRMVDYSLIPEAVYPLGIVLHSENGYGFQMASPEKAICDQLYKISPVKNRSELESLLFEDLRIDRGDFLRLNMTALYEIASRYQTQNLKLLRTYVKI